MMIHEITEKVGRYKSRKRIGRGRSSGTGKTAGRGHKGAGQRAGFKRNPGFEGGQMSFARRIPKRGFTNASFRNTYHVVNLKSLEKHFDNGAEVDAAALVQARLIRDTRLPLKILGEGELTKKLTVTAAKFSGSARSKIEGAGGTATEQPRTKWVRQRPAKAKPADSESSST